MPLLDGVAALAQVSYRTGASVRNWDSYGAEVALDRSCADWQRDLLCDPQTSGGLLVAVAPEEAETVLAIIRQAGFTCATVIGEMHEGLAGIEIV